LIIWILTDASKLKRCYIEIYEIMIFVYAIDWVYVLIEMLKRNWFKLKIIGRLWGLNWWVEGLWNYLSFAQQNYFWSVKFTVHFITEIRLMTFLNKVI